MVTLGKTATTPPPSCPGKIVNNVEVIPCRVEGHVTGFQAIAGGVDQPYEAPFDGKVVAWSITLARPSRTDGKTTTNEVGFFDEFLGNPSEARIGVLRPVEDSSPPQYTLVRQSPLEVLNPYFGSTPIFALDHPLSVLRGQIVALTVPPGRRCSPSTSPTKNTWRGSRLSGHCASKEDIQGGHPQQGVGKTKTYGCYYSNARLLYTATSLRNPRSEVVGGPEASGTPAHLPNWLGRRGPSEIGVRPAAQNVRRGTRRLGNARSVSREPPFTKLPRGPCSRSS